MMQTTTSSLSSATIMVYYKAVFIKLRKVAKFATNVTLGSTLCYIMSMYNNVF